VEFQLYGARTKVEGRPCPKVTATLWVGLVCGWTGPHLQVTVTVKTRAGSSTVALESYWGWGRGLPEGLVTEKIVPIYSF